MLEPFTRLKAGLIPLWISRLEPAFGKEFGGYSAGDPVQRWPLLIRQNGGGLSADMGKSMTTGSNGYWMLLVNPTVGFCSSCWSFQNPFRSLSTMVNHHWKSFRLWLIYALVLLVIMPYFQPMILVGRGGLIIIHCCYSLSTYHQAFLIISVP